MKVRIISAVSAFLLALTASLAIASPAMAAQYYYYSGAQETVSGVTAVRALIEVGNPWLSGYEQHSVRQLGLQGGASLGDAVEIGVGRFNHDTGVFPTNVPRLFVYRWTNGAPGGYSDSTWIPVSNLAGYTRGMDLTPFIGNKILFEMRLTGTTWTFRLNNVEFGRFPASNWTSPTFTSATRFIGYDEIATTRVIGSTCTDLGGAPPILATASAGYSFEDVLYLPGPTSGNLSPFATDATKWNAALKTGLTDAFNSGGPGLC